jgi:hypothetical protein
MLRWQAVPIVLSVLILSACAHQLYTGELKSVPKEPAEPTNESDKDKKPPCQLGWLDKDKEAPCWLRAEAARSRDGYFRIIAVADNVTRPKVACQGSSTLWKKEKANVAITVKAVDFPHWTSNIEFPVYNKSTTADQTATKEEADTYICSGNATYVVVIPFHPLEFGPVPSIPKITYRFVAANVNNLRVFEGLSYIAGIAGVFSGGGPIAAVAAQESTKIAATMFNRIETSITQNTVKLGADTLINESEIGSGGYKYVLPILYFDGSEAEETMEAEWEKKKSDHHFFDIILRVQYTRTLLPLNLDKSNYNLPIAYLQQARRYLTEASYAPDGKSFLQKITTKYPGLIDDLKNRNSIPVQACTDIQTALAGYSPSDRGALYGAALQVGRGESWLDEHFYGSPCFPTDSQGNPDGIAKEVLVVYSTDLSTPRDMEEFSRVPFFTYPTRVLYQRRLSELLQGMERNNAEGAKIYIAPLLADPIAFSSAFTSSGGSRHPNEVAAEISGLAVEPASYGCYLPAITPSFMFESGTSQTSGARAVFLTPKEPRGAMVTIRLNTDLKIDAMDLQPLDDATRREIASSSFSNKSKCKTIISPRLTAPNLVSTSFAPVQR